MLDSVSNSSFHVTDHFQSIDTVIRSLQSTSSSLLLTTPFAQNNSSNAVSSSNHSTTDDQLLLSERTLTSEQYTLILNLKKRQMPLCIIKDTPQDHLRQKTRWGSAVEIEKADNMTKQLALEEKENRCRNTYTFKNNTLSGIHIGPSKSGNAN